MTSHGTRCALAVALALAFPLAAAAQDATPLSAREAALQQKVDRMAAEMEAIKAQLAELVKEREAAKRAAAAGSATGVAAAGGAGAAGAAGTGGASAAPSATAAAGSPGGTYGGAAPNEPATVLTSYGEVNYNRPRNGDNAQADLRRFVLGYQHRFDPKTKVVAEVEVEHAVSSADDAGEVAIEQAYVERQLTPTWSGRAGLFLVPMGLLNENHEPTSYFGVERNFVETAIIPSTWREGGLQVIGSFDNGLTLQAGLSTSFDLNKWDATSTEGIESPLAAIHQELALARAHDTAAFGALNWRGIPGLQVGGAFFTGKANQAQPGVPSARVTLWDLHARWTPGRWDLAGLYARGNISNTEALNAPLVGSATLIPKTFEGWYAQAAYRAWSSGDYALWPFVRYERVNTAKSFADLGPGLTPAAQPTERIITAGVNFNVAPGVVLKADVQRFREARDNNRFDLGLGWSF